MKHVFFNFLLFLFTSTVAQEGQTITLTVAGQGKTIDEARQRALRSAIEQAFGTFISSKTEILNDNLVKDEIVSVANGNIQKFNVVSELRQSNGDYVSSLKATVSISKLTSFCKANGISIDFNGELFAQNMALKELYENSEIKAWKNIETVIYQLFKKSFVYKIHASNPIQHGTKYLIGLDINIELNDNFESAIKLIREFCNSVSLDKNGVSEYTNAGKGTYPIRFPDKTISNFMYEQIGYNIKKDIIYLRSKEVANSILSIPWKVAELAIYNFKIKNGFDEFNLNEFDYRNNKYDENRSQIKVYGGGSIDKKNYGKSSVGYVIDGASGELYQLLGIQYKGSSSKFEGDISKNSVLKIKWPYGGKYIGSGLYGDDNFNIFPIQNPIETNENTLKIFNFVSSGLFLKLHIDDIRDLNSIKQMKEFTIIPLE